MRSGSYGAGVATGLRERKRFKTMSQVQATALELYDQHGYGSVTIEQIADRADVSPSSVYRYFGTKEGILLWNPDHEGDAADELVTVEDGESLMTELRRIARDQLLSESNQSRDVRGRRLHYIFEEPALRSALTATLEAATEQFAGIIAGRTGHDPAELEVQATAGAVTGAVLSALRWWHSDASGADFGVLLDRTFDALQDGLPLITQDEPGR